MADQKMERGTWNRSARRSGGDRRLEMMLPKLTRADADQLAMEAKIRQEFGDDGVERFRQMISEAEGSR